MSFVSQAWFGIIVFLSIATMPAYAVEIFKTSDYQGGHQIWFEVEDFDARNPDNNDDYVLQNDPVAFGDDELNIINRSGGNGGRITYNFDISKADGQGGDWYFWGRVLNPGNQSDYMLVEGDPDDVIPTDPPFDGGTVGALQPTGAWVDGDHRVFERNTGPPWGWSGGGEGHTKQLREGENTMHIIHRQGNANVSWDVMMWADDSSYDPSDADYENASFPVDNPGDFNSDGKIDVADFLIMAENFSEKFPFPESITKGDVDGDTNVDLLDFIEFRDIFNDQGQGVAGVPEPSGISLAGFALLTAIAVMRRKW